MNPTTRQHVGEVSIKLSVLQSAMKDTNRSEDPILGSTHFGSQECKWYNLEQGKFSDILKGDFSYI